MVRKFKTLPPLEELRRELSYDPLTGIFRWLKPRQGVPKDGTTGKGTTLSLTGGQFQKSVLAYYMTMGTDPRPSFVRPRDGDETNTRFLNLKLTTYADSQQQNSTDSWGPCLGCLRKLGLGLGMLSRVFGRDRSTMAWKASRFSGQPRYEGFDNFWREQRNRKIERPSLSAHEETRIQHSAWLCENRKAVAWEKAYHTMYRNKYAHLIRHGKVPCARRMKKRLRKQVRRVWSGAATDSYAVKHLGCTVKQFRAHIRKRMRKCWSAENYGTVWNFDHIRPCAAFNVFDSMQHKQLNHYSNIRPLCVKANGTKGGRY